LRKCGYTLQNIDIESADIWHLEDVKVKLPHDLPYRLSAARLITQRWYIWAPAVIAVCFGIAAFLGRWRRGA
jgi:hypothetical protein